jgi:hypothetical protein
MSAANNARFQHVPRQSVQNHDGPCNVGILEPLRPLGFCDPDHAASHIYPKSTVVIPNCVECLRAGQAIVAAEEGQLPTKNKKSKN